MTKTAYKYSKQRLRWNFSFRHDLFIVDAGKFSKSYYPAVNGDLTSDDYEPELLRDVIASHYELRTPDEEVVGIEYRARIDIYKLKGIDPDEAVAGVISFRGETKAYKYNAKEISSPSWP